MASKQSPFALITELLEPQSKYGEAEAIARSRKLFKLYAMCNRDPVLARHVVSLCRRSFWNHLALLVWTHDSRPSRCPVKPFAPRHVYRAVARFLDQRDPSGGWMHPTVFWDKARQLMVTWFCIARLDWIAHGARYGELPIVSKTEPDADIVLKRAETILLHYPKFYRKAMGLTGREKKRGRNIPLANGAQLMGLPQRGGQAFRGLVPTAFLLDEAAFQAEFAGNYGAVRGTAFDPRTQGIIVSTADLSEFANYTLDTLNGKKGGAGETLDDGSVPGLRIRRTEVGRIIHIRTANEVYEERRDPAWIAQASAGMPMHDFRREFLIDYFARGGKPVFPMLDRDIHVMKTQPIVMDGGHGTGFFIQIPGDTDAATGNQVLRSVRLLRAIDHGTNGYCACVWVAVDSEFDWFVYRAYKKSGWGAMANAQAIADLSEGEEYCVDVIDAMGRLDTGGGQVIDLYRGYMDQRGNFPLRRIEMASKGAGSREQGVLAINQMLLATLASQGPTHSHWADEGYSDAHRDSFLEYSNLFIAPAALLLFEELDQARYDERADKDPAMNQPETTTDMADDATDCLRYLVRSGAHLLRKREAVESAA